MVEIPPVKVDLYPTAFMSYAQDFLAAYRCYDPIESSSRARKFSPAQHYLVCRSIELSLKAFLLLEEQSERYIRLNIRHDLHKALKKAKELGIQRAVNITDADEYEIVKANEWYDRKGFEYFSFQNLNAGKDTLPNLEVLEAVAKQLIEKLESICRATSQ